MVSIYVYGECIVRISLLSAKLSNSYVCSGYKTREIQSVFRTCSIVGLRPHWVTTNYMEQYIIIRALFMKHSVSEYILFTFVS